MAAEFESGSDLNVFMGVYFYLLNNKKETQKPIYSIHLNEEVVCVVEKIKAGLIIRIDKGGMRKGRLLRPSRNPAPVNGSEPHSGRES